MIWSVIVNYEAADFETAQYVRESIARIVEAELQQVVEVSTPAQVVALVQFDIDEDE